MGLLGAETELSLWALENLRSLSQTMITGAECWPLSMGVSGREPHSENYTSLPAIKQYPFVSSIALNRLLFSNSLGEGQPVNHLKMSEYLT